MYNQNQTAGQGDLLAGYIPTVQELVVHNDVKFLLLPIKPPTQVKGRTLGDVKGVKIIEVERRTEVVSR